MAETSPLAGRAISLGPTAVVLPVVMYGQDSGRREWAELRREGPTHWSVPRVLRGVGWQRCPRLQVAMAQAKMSGPVKPVSRLPVSCHCLKVTYFPCTRRVR